MRPRPSEVIAGIRKILADTVAPELSSDHARSRLAEIRAVLAQVDWDDVAFTQKSRAVALRECLESTGWITAALPQPPAEESLAGYLHYRNALDAIAIDVLDRIDSHLDDHPQDDNVRAIRERLLEAL